MTKSATDEPAPELLHGVSLTRYAAVQAGLAEDLPLDAVLEHEGVDAASWADADDAWSDRVAEDVSGDGTLQESFDAHLAEAQDRYVRPVPPLDEDLAAWLDFVRGWSAAPAPMALLAQLGLRSTDLIRLQRGWSRRLAAEPALAKQAQTILERDPGELPTPRPEMGAIEQRIHARAELLAEQRTSESEDEADDDDAADEPDTGPPSSDSREADDDLPPPAAIVDLPHWSSDVVPVHASSTSHRVEPTVLDALPPETLPETASPLRRPFLPFAAAMPSIEPVPAAPSPKVDLGETTTLQPGLLAAALPFMKTARGDARSVPAAVPPTPHAAPNVKLIPELSTTGVLPSGPLAAALPFMKSPAAESPRATPPATPTPGPAAPPSSDLSTTSAVRPGLLAAALPFMKGHKGDMISPFAAAAAPPSAAPPADEVKAVETAPASGTPDLTLAQYASLCAELTVAPEDSEQIFQRYGLGIQRRRLTVDLGFQERLRRNPAEHDEWQRLYRRYRIFFEEAARSRVPDGTKT